MKKFLALFLGIIMILTAAAALGEGETPAEAFIPVTEGISNTAALEGYLRRETQIESGSNMQTTPRKNAVGTQLTGCERKMYDLLRPLIVKAATGKISDTRFTIPLSKVAENKTYTLAELGCTSSSTDAEIVNAFYAKTGAPTLDNMKKVISALLTDMPYELYWFDKTKGWRLETNAGCSVYAPAAGKSAFWSYDEGEIIVEMTVVKEYSQAGQTGTHEIDTILVQGIQNAIANIKQILESNKNNNDYGKMKAYRDWIRDKVTYNHDAAADSTMPYGGPWQLIWVFDGNPETNVVCEGFAKAFKYLCDCSNFTGSTTVICVTGDMTPTLNGEGAHMWNLVTMNDGKRYLTDVTNDHTGTLFLAGYRDSQKRTDGRTAYLYDDYWYAYDEGTSGTFKAEELAVAGGAAYSGTGSPDDPSAQIWKEPVYRWAEDYSSVTALRESTTNEYATVLETVSLNKTTVKEATCLEAEETTYESNEFMNKAFSVQTETVETSPALGHDWGETTYTWSEDHKQVTASRTCKRDSSHTETETVTATSAVTTPATCEQKGKTTYTSAAFTNAAFTAQEITLEDIPAIGHNWGEAEYTWGEENKTLTASRTCKNDATHVETETVETKGEKTKSPTCTEKGKTKYTGKGFKNQAFSAQTKEEEDIPATGHQWIDPSYTWNSDYTQVTAERFCLNDNSHVETETADATSAVTREPTCTDMGVTTYSAEFKNPGFPATKKTMENIDALGHDWGEVTYTWSEDDTKVTASRTCKNDATHVETETVSAGYVVTKKPTCEGKGELVFTGAKFTNEAFTPQTTKVELDALGHEWDEGVVTKAATTEEEGILTYTCKYCTTTREEAIAKLEIQAGWQETDAGRVYVQEDGTKATDWVQIDGSSYCFDENGVMRTGWYEENGYTFYLGTDGKMATGDTEIDGKVYHFNDGGACTGEVPAEPDESTDPDARGWIRTNGGWVYIRNDGTKATGWLQDGGTWYYMNDAGVMQTGWVLDGGSWYYMESSGAMATGWIFDGAWYYMNPSGAMATGWVFDGGVWYYMKSSGAMAMGWVYDGGAWYYMKDSGAMATGWIFDGSAWYYMSSSGAMLTGWITDGSTWYYMKPSGAMQTGWFEDKEAEGRLPAGQERELWYWFDDSGAMAIGWKLINNQWEMFADSGEWLYTYDGK